MNKINKYQNGKIYNIKTIKTNKVYIGSTIEKINIRFSKHKHNFKKFKDNKFEYISSYEILKYEGCYIELIENYPCNSKTELEKREAFHIKNHKNCVNIKIPGLITCEQYMKYNNKKIITCVCGSKMLERSKYRHFKSIKHISFNPKLIL